MRAIVFVLFADRGPDAQPSRAFNTIAHELFHVLANSFLQIKGENAECEAERFANTYFAQEMPNDCPPPKWPETGGGRRWRYPDPDRPLDDEICGAMRDRATNLLQQPDNAYFDLFPGFVE